VCDDLTRLTSSPLCWIRILFPGVVVRGTIDLLAMLWEDVLDSIREIRE
jgi:hypothetical protein